VTIELRLPQQIGEGRWRVEHAEQLPGAERPCRFRLRRRRSLRIAKRLKLAPGTVRNYMSHSITKLRARNRIDAILTAGENNWL
jgi:hypothetical protein